VGVWGSALFQGDGLVHARTLDWDMNGPFRDYPQVTVYHPDVGNQFISVGWTGFIGVLTGINDQLVTLSASNVQLPDCSFRNPGFQNGDSCDSEQQRSKEGVPYTILMREIMQFDATLAEAAAKIKTNLRTVDLIVGLGDGKDNSFNSVQYSHEVANFMDDHNLLPGQPIRNVVYHGVDWDCPTYNHKLFEELSEQIGVLSPEIVKTTVVPKTQTGKTQSIIFNVNEMQLYVAFARPRSYTSPEAYLQGYYALSIDALFEEKPLRTTIVQ